MHNLAKFCIKQLDYCVYFHFCFSDEQNIADGVTAALSRLDSFSANRLPDNIETEIVCKNRLGAELFAYLPNVDQVDAHTIKFVGKDMVEVSKFLQFAISSGALTPK